MKIKSRLWLESEGKIVLGEGRVRLLKAIKEYGSINMACKSLGMSYKKAWKLVEQMNSSGDEKIVIRKTGGSGGGGTIVTPYGNNMISTFEDMKIKVWSLTEKEEKLFNNK